MQCPFQTRRALLLAALATSADLATQGVATRAVAADEEPAGSDERPQKGDLLVQSEGDQEGKLIKPDDLKPGGPPLHLRPRTGGDRHGQETQACHRRGHQDWAQSRHRRLPRGRTRGAQARPWLVNVR